MKSQTARWIWSSPRPGNRNVSSFFEVLTPRVVMYRSSNSSFTKRRTSEVFPTLCSPTRHTFVLSRLVQVIGSQGHPASRYLMVRGPFSLVSSKDPSDHGRRAL